eukprot:116150_1
MSNLILNNKKMCLSCLLWFLLVYSVTMNFKMIILDTAKMKEEIRDHIDLSFIIATRNDNYSANPIRRLRFTLQNLLLFKWKISHNISTEIVIIEWNTVKDNKHIWEFDEITELLQFKNNNPSISDIQIKFYSIPSQYNDRINCDESGMYCPFFEYSAKNAGIRRSKGIWKVIMNIDDLWGINLLHFVAHSIQYNLLDINGIYQAFRRKQIEFTDPKILSKYIDNIEFIPIDSIIHNPIIGIENIQHCLKKHISNRFELGPGDFILIHNHSLYDFYGGAFVEICSTDPYDYEFVLRQIIINKLNEYHLRKECSYMHLKHIKEHTHREPVKDVNMSNKRIHCNQDRFSITAFIQSNKHIPNDTLKWRMIYEQTHNNWGISNVTFNFTVF